MKDKKSHLPLIGVGPIIVTPQLLLTVLSIMISKKRLLDFELKHKVPIIIFGVIIILSGLLMWGIAIFKSKIEKNIRSNTLVTTGVYSWVRNPIYSAFLLFCIGAICINANPVLLFIPFICWGYMTVFLKKTEEVWLHNLYGEKYEEYCKKVNRCIPWFPKL